MSNMKAIKSYQGFEEGSYVARKGRLCLIKKIHFEMHPPAVTVLMMDTNTEVGTEFDRLKHIKSWFCDICSAQNDDNSATKCSFCKMNRSFKERITIQDANDQNNQQQKPESKQMEEIQVPSQKQTESKSENTKQSESTELASSSESDITEPDQAEEPESEQEREEIDDEYEIIDAPQSKEPENEPESDSELEDEEEPQNPRFIDN